MMILQLRFGLNLFLCISIYFVQVSYNIEIARWLMIIDSNLSFVFCIILGCILHSTNIS